MLAALCIGVGHGAPAMGQATGMGRSDTVVTPMSRPDSAKPPRADSVQAPFGRGAPLPTLDIGESYTFTRDQLFATGALTLTDLLARVPGVTTFSAGWLPSPQVAAYGGDFTRVRIFYDGVELDDLEPRNGGVPDLSWIPLWSLEFVTLERSANELRVDLRSWQYDHTRPYTRADILTGEVSTDIYRAFYAKRFYNGAGLQIGGQQYSTTDLRNGGGGQGLDFLGRYGVARQRWSMDVTVMRTDHNRTSIYQRYGGGELIPPYEATNTLAYLRAALGHPGGGPFLQFVAATLDLHENSAHFDSLTLATQPSPYGGLYGFPPDTVDSTASLAQYVTTAGLDKGPLQLRLIDRYRRRDGVGYNAGTATAALTSGILSANALAERDQYTGYTNLEGGVRLQPLPFLAVSAVGGARRVDPLRSDQPDATTVRAEAGIRLFHGPWLSGGVIRRDTAVLAPPVVFDSAFRERPVGPVTGALAALRGPLGYGFFIDASGVSWQHPTAYLPKYQAHTEARFYTQWLSRFPSGNFSFSLSGILDYRSDVAFAEVGGDRVAGGSQVYTILAELRILRGVISFQRRNTTLLPYFQVPGFLMPRGVNVYGVRWYFFD